MDNKKQQYNLKRPIEQVEKEDRILEAIKEERGYKPSINDIYAEALTLLANKITNTKPEGVEDVERVS